MAECRNKILQRKTKKHPRGVVTAKKCMTGKKLQQIPAVKAWSRALREIVGFKKGEFSKIPKKGTAKYNAVKARMRQIMSGSAKRAAPKPATAPVRRSKRIANKGKTCVMKRVCK